MNTGAGISLKMIKISKNRGINPKLGDIIWRIRGESGKEIKGKGVI